jgi:hypothetical protein
MSGPCEWPVARDCLPALPDQDDPNYAAAAAQRRAAEDLAVGVLWALSGRQFGVCPYIARPCIETVGPWWPQYSYYTTSYSIWFDGGQWITQDCGCHGRCRSSGPGAVHLPGPAQDIIEIIIDGTILDPNEYVLEGDVLHRTGGRHIWPHQDLTRPMGEPNTWSVEFLKGVPVPAGVDRLTGLLAKELYLACTGGQCRLPSTVVSTTRQGVTHQFDPSRMYEQGKTGLREVDLWLSSVNPSRLQCAPSVI